MRGSARAPLRGPPSRAFPDARCAPSRGAPRPSRAVSICATFLIAILFVSEFRHFRLIETVDKLDVDVSSTHAKIAINLDITLPSLPCSEFVVDAVDASGVQQTRLSDMLNKLRLDRYGVPVDIPRTVDWTHTTAPAFRHRKVRGAPAPPGPLSPFRGRRSQHCPLAWLTPRTAGAQPARVGDGQPARDHARHR